MTVITTFISNHKALLTGIAAAIASAADVVPEPYNGYLQVAAAFFTLLAGGQQAGKQALANAQPK